MNYKISKRNKNGVKLYVIMSSPDGTRWVRGDCGDYTSIARASERVGKLEKALLTQPVAGITTNQPKP
jgi:hypothetical protein